MGRDAAAARPPSRRSRLNPPLLAGAATLTALVLLAVVAPLVWRDAAQTLTADLRLPPGWDHPLGTDPFGRDVLARALVATRLTLTMSLLATAVSFTAGVAIGALLHLAPRWPREVALRLIDSAVAFPSLVFALVIAAVLGPGASSAVIAIGVAGIPGFARLTANLAASVSHREFVRTAALLGVPGPRILVRHVLPNVSGPLLVLLTSSFALSLLEISSLSFVGLGVQSPQFDWGRLLNEALPSIYDQPSLVVGPSVMLVVAGVGAMLLGDGVATALDPRRGRRPLTASPLSPDAPASPAVEPSTATGAAAPGTPADQPAVLVVAGLSVRSAEAVVVDDVSFTIRAGEVVGLVGESGSGKSTIAMAVAGLLPDGLAARARRLELCDAEGDLDLLGSPPARRAATGIGVVYQDPGTTFNPALRLGTQLTEVERVHLRRGRRDAVQDMVRALTEVSVTEPARRLRQHPHELSGGMLQRASIAAAIATGPRLLVADEPTTALDVTVQAEVLRQLRRINAVHSTAMLFISHDIGVVGALCDRVLVLHRGRIVDRTTGAALRSGHAGHPYTRALLAATPSTADADRPLHAVRWDGREVTAP
jgi:peptide/nickel transport system permease protein